MLRTITLFVTLFVALPMQAAVIGYNFSWEGNGGYSVEGMFSFDDSSVGLVADETELVTFMAEAFDPQGMSLGIRDLTNPGDFFNFNFEIASQSILQSGLPFTETGLTIGDYSGPWLLIATSACIFDTVQLLANVDCNNLLDENEVGSVLSSLKSQVPLPAAAWLFGSALLGLGVIKRKKG